MKKTFNAISKSKVQVLLNATILSLAQNVFAADEVKNQNANDKVASVDFSVLTQVLTLVEKFAIIGGGLWAVWGVIVLAGGLKDKNGPALQSGIWQIVGGGLIIAAAAVFKTIVK